ncbi:hypothetical protein [Radiobacillus sp. PE A8.2]|uniref:hypothetical protein n=1 Tax=Radiobacillus sp. PE A8.2 TaxID=3380349 RepID=UPI00388E56B8
MNELTREEIGVLMNFAVMCTEAEPDDEQMKTIASKLADKFIDSFIEENVQEVAKVFVFRQHINLICEGLRTAIKNMTEEESVILQLFIADLEGEVREVN